jgi:hypothetical protein
MHQQQQEQQAMLGSNAFGFPRRIARLFHHELGFSPSEKK